MSGVLSNFLLYYLDVAQFPTFQSGPGSLLFNGWDEFNIRLQKLLPLQPQLYSFFEIAMSVKLFCPPGYGLSLAVH